jgi:ribosomal protein S6--L-glutamate ligase
VVLCESQQAAESVIEDALWASKRNEHHGAGVHQKPAAHYPLFGHRRQGHRRDETSNGSTNLHRGSSASLIKITPEGRMTAIPCSQVMGLSVAGVDILRSNHGRWC